MNSIGLSGNFRISAPEKRFLKSLLELSKAASHNPLVRSTRVQKVSRGKDGFISKQKRPRGKKLCKIACKLYSLISFRALLFSIYHSITLSVYVQTKLSLNGEIERKVCCNKLRQMTSRYERMRHISKDFNLLCKR